MSCRMHHYTLTEMLTVIAIVAILAGLLIPAVNTARERGRETSAAAGCNTIATAIRQYHMTYSKMPCAFDMETSTDVYTPVGGGTSTSKITDSNDFSGNPADDVEKYDRIIFALSNQLPSGSAPSSAQTTKYNKKKMSFLDVPPEYFESGDKKGYFANPWGQRYYIVYNIKGSHRMKFNPGFGSITLGTDAAVYSKLDGGGKRLATSWKGITTF